MQINAIRLAGVGRFRDGVALEGFAPGLNVLAAPNEAGKSTLLRALRTLFTVAHSSRGQKLEMMRADGAAAARIQCEFTIGGISWRLTKQYLAGRSAELVRVDIGETWAGGDAEDRLTALTAGPGGLVSALPSLWIAQGESFALPAVSDDHRQVFQDLVRAEMDAASGAGRLVQIVERAKADLGKLVTAGRGQPRGAFLEARRACAEAEEVLKSLQEKAERSDQRRRQLAEYAAREKALADPSAEAARQKAAADATAAVEAAREARQKRDVAAARRAEADTAHKAALAKLQNFDTTIAEVKAASDAAARLADEIGTREREWTQVEAQVVAVTDRLAALRDDEAAARAAQLAAVRAAQRSEVEKRCRALDARLEQARRLAGELTAIDAAAPPPVPGPDDLAALRNLDDKVRALEAKAAAVAPSVTVDYAPHSAGRFRIAGTALEDGEVHAVRDVTRIDADGLGTVTIRPANADPGGVENELARQRSRLAEALARLSVPDRETAEARAGVVAEYRQKRTEAQVRLRAHAPDGVAELEAEAMTAARDLAILSDPDAAPTAIVPEPDAVAQRLADVAHEIAGNSDELRQASARRESVREALTRARASHAAVSEQRARQAATLPPEGVERDAARVRLADEAAAAEASMHACVRDLGAWTAAALNDHDFAAREADRAEAERRWRAAHAELAEVRAASREIAGALRRDVEDGIEAAVEEARQKLDRLRQRVRAFEAEVAGLQRLVQAAQAVIAAQRAEMAGPIAARMQDLAEHVFPGVTFRLGADFSVEAVVRDGAMEALDRVSDGTREQVAVLVRLALARCIAEAQGPLPVILDDALVYADDQRLERTFAALAEAAATQQVIVLTCHQRAFQPLATRHAAAELALAPWRSA